MLIERGEKLSVRQFGDFKYNFWTNIITLNDGGDGIFDDETC